MRRKFLSVLLALSMVLTLLPVTALAVEETNATHTIAFSPKGGELSAETTQITIQAMKKADNTDDSSNVTILYATEAGKITTTDTTDATVDGVNEYTSALAVDDLFTGNPESVTIYAVAVSNDTPPAQVSTVTSKEFTKADSGKTVADVSGITLTGLKPAIGDTVANKGKDAAEVAAADSGKYTVESVSWAVDSGTMGTEFAAGTYTATVKVKAAAGNQFVTTIAKENISVDSVTAASATPPGSAAEENEVTFTVSFTLEAEDIPEPISAVTVNMDAVKPTKGGTPAAEVAATTAHGKGTITWSPTTFTSKSKFKGGETYTAAVVLPPASGETWADSVTVTVATGKTVTGTKDATSGNLKFSVQYGKLADAAVTGITAALNQGVSYKVDDTPAATNFKVTATYDDGETADITDGTDVTISPTTAFKTAGSQTITVTYGGKNATVNVTVGKKDMELAIKTAPTAADINYGQALSASALTDGKVVEKEKESDADAPAIGGTWQWSDPTDTLNAGDNQSIGVKFVPTANENINYTGTLTSNATISVKKIAAQGNITVDIQGGYVQNNAPLPAPTSGTGVLNEPVAGTTTWTSDEDGNTTVTTVTGSTGDSVTYYWTFAPTVSTNYTGNVTGTATFNVTDKSILTYEFTNKTASATYGGAISANAVKIKVGGVDSDSATTGLAFDYSSSDTNIATVAADGTVTAVKAGKVTITATHTSASLNTENYVCNTTSASYELTINKAAAAKPDKVDSTKVDKTSNSITIAHSETGKLYAVATGAAPAESSAWKAGTGNALVFSGLTANTAYNVYVKTAATDTHNESEASDALAVTTDAAPSVNNVTVSPDTLNLKVGGNGTLTATVDPNGTAVTWTSSNEAVATVDATGKVTAVAAGTATITATAGDKSDTCAVTVTSGGSHSSSGGGGGGGGTTSSTVTVPVSGDDNKVEVSAKVSGSTATIDKIDGLEKVIDSDANTGVVEIDLTALNKDIDTVSISASSIEDIAKAAADSDNDVDGLSVKLDSGTVEFDADALEAIADQATSSSIQLVLEKTNSSDLSSTQRDAVKDMDIHGHFELTLTGGRVITDFKGGSVSVRIPFTVPSGKEAANFIVLYVANDGTTEEMNTRYSNGFLSFTTGHFSKYVIAYKDSEPVEPVETPTTTDCDGGVNCPARRFTDVATNLWYHKAIDYVLTNGLMSGVGDSSFAPNANLSRAMLAQILYNQAGRPAVSADSAFDDVAAGMWYTNAIAWAAEEGVVSGLGDGKFGPNNNITREQLAVMLYRYAGSPAAAGGGSLDRFADADKASSYAQNALVWATGMGIMSGKGGGMLDPQGQATRAEVAQMLYNYLDM